MKLTRSIRSPKARYFLNRERRIWNPDDLALCFKFIAYSPDGAQFPFVGDAVYLFSYSLYMNVDGTAVVMALKKGPAAAELWLDLPRELTRYVVRKGSICVDGVSLTVASVSGSSFSVAVIPETLARTTLGSLRAGQKVNIETDMIARYVEKLLGLSDENQPSAPPSGLTMERLAEMGW